MRERNYITRLKLARAKMEAAEKALSNARLDACAALSYAIAIECSERKETRTQFAKRHGVSKAHVSDMIYGRRYSPAVVSAIIESSPTTPTRGASDA